MEVLIRLHLKHKTSGMAHPSVPEIRQWEGSGGGRTEWIKHGPQRRGECRHGCRRRRACTTGTARSPLRGARPPAPPAR